jgi:hypothetical protein
MDMRFWYWDVRSLYRTHSLTAVAKEILKYKSDLLGVQEVRWDRGGTEPTGSPKLAYQVGGVSNLRE